MVCSWCLLETGQGRSHVWSGDCIRALRDALEEQRQLFRQIHTKAREPAEDTPEALAQFAIIQNLAETGMK